MQRPSETWTETGFVEQRRDEELIEGSSRENKKLEQTERHPRVYEVEERK